MMSDFRGVGGSKMTPKNRIIEVKNRIKGGGVKNDSKNQTSFMMIPCMEFKLRKILSGSI